MKDYKDLFQRLAFIMTKLLENPDMHRHERDYLEDEAFKIIKESQP